MDAPPSQPDASQARAPWPSWADTPANGGQSVTRGADTATLMGRGASRPEGTLMKPRVTVTVDVQINLARCLWPLAWALVWLLR